MKSNSFSILFVLNCFISFSQNLSENNTGRINNTVDNPFIAPENEAGDPMPVYMDGLWHLYTLAGN